MNMPWGPPSNAIAPPAPDPDGSRKRVLDDPNEECGSIIGCENQSLGEALPVTGTSFLLSYNSDRTPGREDAYTLIVPVSGATLPDTVQTMYAEVRVAGRLYTQSFAPTTNVNWTVQWDGRDAYGRLVAGEQRASVSVSYDYTPQYYSVPSALGNSFARVATLGASVTNRQWLQNLAWR